MIDLHTIYDQIMPRSVDKLQWMLEDLSHFNKPREIMLAELAFFNQYRDLLYRDSQLSDPVLDSFECFALEIFDSLSNLMIDVGGLSYALF